MPAHPTSNTLPSAEMLVKAAELFGGQQEAQRWMSLPVMGLDGARPVELLRTLQGAQLVTAFLERLEHGVYN
jgi:putative toxin-antitoxin system antitoxin component (TIGR02293 family)